MNQPEEMIVVVYKSLKEMGEGWNGIEISNVIDLSASATGGWYIGTTRGGKYLFPSSVFIYVRPSEQYDCL